MIQYDAQAAQVIEASYNTPDIQRQRLHTLDALALQAGEQVLDCGCGTGLLTAAMAQQVGAAGQVWGIDNSADMLAVAQQRCADLPNVTLQCASATELPLPNASVAAASCIQTLLYVPEVEKALAELTRVLNSGGKLVVIETDWRGLVLNTADLALTERIIAAWDQVVPNPHLAPQLPSLFAAHGVKVMQTQAIPIVNTTYQPANFSYTSLAWMALQAREQGAISSEEEKHWLEDLQTKAQQGAFFFSINRFLCSGVKL